VLKKKRIVFTDECNFRFGQIMKRAYARKGGQLRLPWKLLKIPKVIKVVVGVSIENGFKALEIFDNNLNSDSFCTKTKSLKKFGNNLVVFCNNVSYHKSRKTMRHFS
jgi:hypothetical protein